MGGGCEYRLMETIDHMGIRSVADLIRAQFWDKVVNFYSLQFWNMLNNINSSMI